MLNVGVAVVVVDKDSSAYMSVGKVTSIASYRDPVVYGIKILSTKDRNLTIYSQDKHLFPLVTNVDDLLQNIYRRYHAEYLRGLIFAAESVSKNKDLTEVRKKINRLRHQLELPIEEYVKEVEGARRCC